AWHAIDGNRVVYYPWQVMPDPNGGSEEYRFGCATILEYAGAGLWSHQEDLYNPREAERVMKRWMAAAPPRGGLLFCHPAASAVASSGADANDPIAPARLREAAYLGSTAFVEDLAAAGIGLGRAWLTTQSV
ncbi:MAG: hypothetical protein JHC40_00660, partial [Burkholderiales bacterium]|nr:hypothetical protein [Burkholderiales bacterium]